VKGLVVVDKMVADNKISGAQQNGIGNILLNALFHCSLSFLDGHYLKPLSQADGETLPAPWNTSTNVDDPPGGTYQIDMLGEERYRAYRRVFTGKPRRPPAMPQEAWRGID
jgi:hypothetical protein